MTSFIFFQRYNLDSQLQDIFNPKVTLKSGGYIIIDQTEALVAVDVNSEDLQEKEI